ncbi:MAG: spore coat associated protein CotJA [Lachnospiraceae bacterium]|nr:spore coat associated protein CotJA [Lachnospiraceae bacterium]
MAYGPRQHHMSPADNRSAGMSRRERFMDDDRNFPIGMAYVPWQIWGNLYPPEQGLREGTIFQDLNQIFCGKRGNRA